MSASMAVTRLPSIASADARLAVTVVFPTPPLPEVTVKTCALILFFLSDRLIPAATAHFLALEESDQWSVDSKQVAAHCPL